MRILTVNSGSSSLKLAVFELQGRELVRLAKISEPIDSAGYAAAIAKVLVSHSGGVDVVVHRVVHGGDRFTHSQVIDAEVEVAIEALASLAPLHNPPALLAIQAVRQLLGTRVVQIAAFDTAFFCSLPPAAARYALPRALTDRLGIRRFGFHGLAHEGRWRRWAQIGGADIAGSRVISLHLGAGCSMAAIADGKAQDVSMGFSPLEGLVMATRCGDVDPSVLLYLLRSGELSLEQLGRMLNHESGLLGLSGHSGDMRVLINSSNPADQLAVDVFVLRVRKYLGAFAAVLGGVDAILIGGGIGEYQPGVRARIFEKMKWLGVELDAAHNDNTVNCEAGVHTNGSAVALWVIPTDEERALADEAIQLMSNQ